MFVQNPDMTTLRQGDVIADVLFPLARMDRAIAFLGTYSPAIGHFEPTTETMGRSQYQSAQLPVTVTLCAVFSQDCDVDSRQEHPPPAFLLCRVMEVPESLRRSAGYLNLQGNVDPYGEARPYFQLFYLGPIVGRDGVFMADYAQVMTVAWSDYRHVLKKKILELDNVERAKFRVKAGAHIGRPADEEIEAGIANPWHPEEPRPRGEE